MATATKNTDLTKNSTDTPESTAMTAESYFEQLQTTDTNIGGKDITPAFVGFCHKKSNDEIKNAMKAAGGNIDQFYLSRNGTIIPLPEFRYHLFESARFWTKQDSQGRIISVKDKDPTEDGYSEHGFALVAVRVGKELYPARFQCRAGLYQCLKPARQMLDTARDPEKFGKQGESFAVAATLKQVPARFLVTASGKMEKSASNGFDYVKGKGTVAPSKIEDGNVFISAIQKPEFMQELMAVRGVYLRQIAGLQKQVK